MAEDQAEKTAGQQLKPFAFKPGESGNPAGRPKGSRNKLGEEFISALHDDFKEHGVKAIQAVRAEKPDAYLKVIAAIVPKEVHLKDGTFDGLSDDDLAILLAFVRGEAGRDQESTGGGAETAH
jgi:hypothetical protein